MTDAPVTTGAMPLAEFIRRYEEEGPFELIEGEIVAVSPSVPLPNIIAKRLLLALAALEERGTGVVFSELAFVLDDTSDWVRGSRVPDVMFYNAERFNAYCATVPDWETRPFALVPDVVAEVVSPTDRHTDITAKVRRYLDDGVRLVWVVDPQARVVTAHRAGSDHSLWLSGEAVLSGADVIPGFELPLSRLFA